MSHTRRKCSSAASRGTENQTCSKTLKNGLNAPEEFKMPFKAQEDSSLAVFQFHPIPLHMAALGSAEDACVMCMLMSLKRRI